MHDFTLPIGPQHPSIDEPSCLRISLEGERIVEASLRLGYVHRGIEKLLEGKMIEQGLEIVDRICGICSVAHSSCYTRTIERMLRLEVPERVKYLRTLVSELARIQSHMFWAGFMLHEIGFETMLAYFLREREKILEILERITGSRIHFSFYRIGTVRRDVSKVEIRYIEKKIGEMERKLEDYFKIMKSDRIIKARLEDVGIITKADAKDYSLVGPVARASGVKIDVRKDDPYDAYDEVDFVMVIEDSGDAFARMIVRMKEIFESIKIVKQILKNLPRGTVPPITRFFIEEGMEVGRVEAPRGENFHLIKIDQRRLSRVRIRPPTLNFMNIFTKLLKGVKISDVPVILASLDPCFACMERVILIKDGKREVLSEDEFRTRYT